MLTDDHTSFTAQRRTLRREGIFLSRIETQPAYGVVFPGHGSQYLDQLAELRWSDSTISEVFDEADQLYGSRYGHTLSARIYTDLGATAASLSEPTVMQCAIFTASIAQFRRLMTFSAPPTVVIGHSLGEYAAYVAAGVLSFADGLTGVMARAETVSELPRDRRGTMLAVRIRTEEEDRTYRRLLLLASTSGDIGEAIANSSTQRVVSGAEEPIAAFSRTAEAHHLSVTRLRVTHAYHSPVLRPCVAPLRARLEQLTFHAPSMTVLSSITGETLDQSKDPGLAGLLAAQLVQPFDFGALLTKAADWGVKDFVEAGPGGVLSGIIESEKGETSCIPMDSRRRPAAEDERRVRLYLTSLGIPGLAAKPPLAAAKTTAEAVTDLVSTVTGYPRYAIPGGTPLERLGLVPALRQQLSTRLQTEYGPDFGDLSWSINRLAARLGGGGNYETSHPTPPDEAEPRVCCAEGAGASPLPGGTSIDAPATTSNQTDRLVQELITEFASATGYPTDVIEPNLDLEADLGIDSVKQAQVITTLATRHHIPQDTLDLTGAATITLIAQRLTQAHPNTNTQPDCPNHTATQNGTHPGTSADPPNPTPQLPHHDLATGLAQELITEFASATGYPTDVIEPNLDLEADLGIDSVKQAQVITTLATRHHIPQDTLDLTGAATITLIAQRLTQAHPNTNNETTRPPNTQDQTTHPSAGSEEDDEVTAISTEETEPEIAMRYLPRAIVRDLEQSPHTPRDLRGLRLLLLPATNRDLTERTQNLLEAAGADVWISTVLIPDGDSVDQGALAANLAAEHQRCGPRDGIVDLSSCGPSRDALALDTMEFSAAWRRQYAHVFSVYQEYFADLAKAADRAVLAVLTNCGGGYSLKATTIGDALGCLSVGFVKSLAKELPGLSLCLVDVDTGAHVSAADKLVDELAAGSIDDEVSYLGDQRHVIKVVPVPLSPAPRPRSTSAGAIVFSGGSRGIALECALALANSDLAANGGQPSPIVILGRSRLDSPDSQPYLDLTDEEFTQAQPQIMSALHRSDPAGRPLDLQRRFRQIANDRQLWKTTRRLGTNSAPFEYLTCDVTDSSQVAQVMADVRSRHGGIRGIVHAAGLESLGQLPKKNYVLAEKVVATKLQGFYHLVRAADIDTLDFLIAFTSISGRFGMDGQTEYTAGSAAVSAICSQLSRRHHATRVVAIDWTAWAEVGMATHQSVREVQEQQRGLRYLPPAEGCRHFLRELEDGGFDSQVMIFGPLGTNEPRSALSCLTADRRAIADPIIHGSIVDPGAFPMVEASVQCGAASDVFTRRLDPRLDTMLIDHLVQGSPTLPGVFHLEAMAEAARLATGRTDLMIESAAFENFVKCPEGRVCDLQITVSAKSPSRIEATIRADVVSPGGVILVPGRQRSRAVFGPGRAVPGCPYDWSELLADRATHFDLDVYYAAAAPIITFGPGFRTLREAWRTSQGVVVGRFNISADTRRLLPEGSARLITEPLLLDNVGRLALIDVFHRFGDHVVPVNVTHATIQKPVSRRAEVLGCIKVQPGGSGQYTLQLHVAELDGTPLMDVGQILLQKLNNHAARRNLSHVTV